MALVMKCRLTKTPFKNLKLNGKLAVLALKVHPIQRVKDVVVD